jgi:hypothetical protein
VATPGPRRGAEPGGEPAPRRGGAGQVHPRRTPGGHPGSDSEAGTPATGVEPKRQHGTSNTVWITKTPKPYGPGIRPR